MISVNGIDSVLSMINTVSTNVTTVGNNVNTIDGLQDVPAQNSASNAQIRDVVGNKTDDENGNSIYSRAYIQDIHTHAAQKVYPTLANGVTLTGGVGAWALGEFAEVIPVNTVTSPFDIHFLNIGAVSATDTYEMVLFSGLAGAEVEIGRARVVRTAAQSGTAPVPFQCSVLPANTRISSKVASASGGGDTLVFSAFYHTY